MGRFGSLQQWDQQAQNPAAPLGMRQQAQAGGAYEAGGFNRFGNLGPPVSEQGYTQTAQSWFTGANQAGTQNGWDTRFTKQFIDGQNKAAENGTLASYFEQPKATGVVLYDHTSEDAKKVFKLGDVYQNGHKVSNVYDQFDKDTANLMMSQWLFDSDTLGHTFAGKDGAKNLDRKVQEFSSKAAETAEAQKTQDEFNTGTKQLTKEFEEGQVDEGQTLASAFIAGGTTGALAGTIAGSWTGPGALISGAAGFVIGGAAAWLNRDALTQQAARAYQITGLASSKYGTAAGIASGVEQWSGYVNKLAMPQSNLVQGATDKMYGATGDGRSTFYDGQKNGDSAPAWLKVSDVVATASDSLMQFASPVGRAVYTVQMTGQIAGKTGTLATTGSTFDYNRGQFTSAFTDDKGNFDMSRSAAGIGSVAIDVAQLGMVHGLVGKINAVRGTVGKDAIYGGSIGATGATGEAVTSRIPILRSWKGSGTALFGRTEAQKTALAAKTATEEHATGFKYVVDKTTGEVIGPRRVTLSLLAPSEQLPALTTAVQAMRMTGRLRSVLSTDDFYLASKALASGEHKIQTTLTNAFGEAYEEGLQTFLDNHSQGHSTRYQDLVSSAAYGFAGGLGMGLGMGISMPNAQDQLFSQAKIAHRMRTGGAELSRTEFNAMNAVEQRSLAAMGKLEAETARAAYRQVSDEQAIEMNAGVVGANHLLDATNKQLSKALNKAPRTDGNFVVTQIEDGGQVDKDGNLLEGSMPADAVVASARQTTVNMANHLRGVGEQIDQLEANERLANEKLAADPSNEERQRIAAEATKNKDSLELVLRWGRELLDDMEQRTHSLEGADDTTRPGEVLAMNEVLRESFHGNVVNWTTDDGTVLTLTPEDKVALSRAATMLFARDPHDHSGSYQVLVPQVSEALTREGTDNILEISHAILPALRADYDGDKVRPLNQVILNEEEFVNARSGAHFIGAGTTVNVGAMKYEKWIIELLSKSLTSTNTTLSDYAAGTKTDIGQAIRNRYSQIVDGEQLVSDEILDTVLDTFYEAVDNNDPDARAKVLDGLAEHAGSQITKLARTDLSNEWLWIDQLMRASLQRFQENYAAHRPDVGPSANVERVAVNKMTVETRQRIAANAAVPGITLAQQTAGDSMFRKFQKLHYSSFTAKVRSAMSARKERMNLVEMAQWYEMLSQQMTTAEIDAIHAKDEITGRVLVQLSRLAADAKKLNKNLSEIEAMVLVANMQVLDLEVDFEGVVLPNGKKQVISLAQMLLKQSIALDRRKNDSIFAVSPELQSKHARLEAMTKPGSSRNPVNAERAFVEVFGSQQLYSLLGDDAFTFGPHLTVEQFVREFVSRSEGQRRYTVQQLHRDPAYLGRKRSKNMPYDIEELQDSKGDVQLSAFRALADAMTAVGSNRITLNKDGELIGELANRSNDTSKDIRTAHKRIREAIFRFKGMNPKSSKLSATDIEQIMVQNPEFAHDVIGLIPAEYANAVLRNRGDKTYVANWLYEAFALDDAKHAEMMIWRNLLQAEWFSKGKDFNEEEIDDGTNGRDFNRLTRRMHRIMWNLGQRGNELYLQQFLVRMEESKNLDEFISWVNTAPGLRGEQAPLTAWVDDVADFDKDKDKGGWTTVLQGADLRAAIKQLRRSSTNLVRDLKEEERAIKSDRMVLDSIGRVVKRYKQDADVAAGKKVGALQQLQPGDEDNYQNFEKAIEQAGEMYVGLGPNAMIYQTIGAVLGFYPQAHNKGTNPDNIEVQGEYDAMHDAYDYTTNYERLLASMTALNLDAVSGNMSGVAKDGGRTMDDHGRVVEWAQPTVELMLEMFKKTETRSLARSILFPQVQERDFDGVMRTKMLTGKSLESFINNRAHKELFPAFEKLSQDSALRYCAMVEAQSRQHGGHFSLQRAVNDIVIAKTSAADHVLSVAEIEKMTIDAYYLAAKILQDTGSIEASLVDPDTGALKDPSVDLLGDMMDQMQKAQRIATLARTLNVKPEDQELIDVAIERQMTQRMTEAEDERQHLLDTITDHMNPDDEKAIIDQAAFITEEIQQFETRVRMLLSDNTVSQVVAMFDYDDSETLSAEHEANKIQQQHVLTEYIDNHMSMIERSSSSLLTLHKLTEQLMDSGRAGRIHLTDKEWKELSNAVIAVHMSDIMETTGANVSVPPYPSGDHEEAQRYYDTSYSYLLKAFMDRKSPVLQAAKDIHLRAGRHGIVAKRKDVVERITNDLFDDFGFGPWTSDIPRASMEANQRLDSAAAASAIAMAGNSPKRQAIFAAALQRTFRDPAETGADLTSTASLNFIDLENAETNPFIPVGILLPGKTKKTERPISQLNNRFASSVVMNYIDPATGAPATPMDLLAFDKDLGRYFNDPQAEGIPYQEIHMDRVRKAMQRAVKDKGLEPSAVTIEIKFFHPDSQPVDSADDKDRGVSWHNNVFFEGTSFKLDADVHKSLTSTLWFQFGSLSPTAQAKALEASKLGMRALQDVTTQTAAQLAALESNWRLDFAGMLRDKAEILLTTDLGFGDLDVEFFNAVYKDMKIRHFVRGKDNDGNTVVWTAEEMIAWQIANTDEATGKMPPLPMNGAELWTPSDTVLRSVLGEIGTQGVKRPNPNSLEIHLENVDTWQGVSETMLASMEKGLRGDTQDLQDTRIANRARQQQLQVRPRLTTADISKYDARRTYLFEREQKIHQQRIDYTGRTDEKGGFNPQTNLANILKDADKMLRSENIAFDWAGNGVMFIGPRKPLDVELSKMMLHELEALLDADGNRAGWILSDNGPHDIGKGILTSGTLRSGKGPMKVAPHDLVVMQLNTYRGSEAQPRIYEQLQFLVDQGATIHLGSSDGTTDHRAFAAEKLRELGYESIAGSQHVYRSIHESTRYQNLKARESSLVEVRRISKRNRVAVFLTPDKPVGENAAWVNSDNARLGAIAVTMNLVPTDAFGGFNIPAPQISNKDQINQVIAHLNGLDTDAGRGLMREQANKDLKGRARKKADKEFDRKWKQLIRRINSTGSVLPKAGTSFGTGDFIPLVDNSSPTRVLLYRHGYKAPMRDELDKMTAQMLPGQMDYANIAVYPTKLEPASTTHTGKVVEFTPRAGQGMAVELEIPLSVFGDKKVLEWNGMKYLLTPKPSSIKLPKKGFFPNWGIDIIASMHDHASKEATDGTSNNYSNAFAYFGMDFKPDVAKFFGVDEATAVELMHEIATDARRIQIGPAHELINAPRVLASYRELLAPIAQRYSQKVDASWIERMNEPSVEAQITTAMMIYLSTPDAKVEDVMYTGGFNDATTDPDATALLMPRLFTQIFDNAKIGSELRVEITRRINDQIDNEPGSDESYIYHQDHRFEIRNGVPPSPSSGGLSPAPPRTGWRSLLQTHNRPIARRADGEWIVELTKRQAAGDDAWINQNLTSIDSLLRTDNASLDEIAAELEKWQTSAKRIGEHRGKDVTWYKVNDPRYGRATSQAGMNALANALHVMSDDERHYNRRSMTAAGTLNNTNPKAFTQGSDAQRAAVVKLYSDYIEDRLQADIPRDQIEQYVLAAGQFVAGWGSSHAVPGTGIDTSRFDILRGMVDQAPRIDHSLYRGLAREPRFDNNGILQGSTADLASWTTELQTADKFTAGTGQRHMLKLENGQALDIGQFGGMNEYLAQGTFKLIRAYPDPLRANQTIHEVEQLSVTLPQTTPATGDPSGNMIGQLMFAEAHSSGDNPIKNGMSFDDRGKQAFSPHAAAVAYGSIGTQTAYPQDIAKARIWADADYIPKFKSKQDLKDGGVWRLFTDVKPNTSGRWRVMAPAESMRMTMAAEAVTQFRKKIKKDEASDWDPKGVQELEYKKIAIRIVEHLGLQTKQKDLVDFWVRQMLGAPDGHDKDGKHVGWISGEAAIEVAKEIEWNVRQGYFPVVSAMVPLMHVHDVQAIYRANRNVKKPWQPKQSIGGADTKPATTWNMWIETALGAANTSDNMFDPLYLLALDGMMHTYQSANSQLLDIPVSMDSLLAMKLLDEDTNRLLVSLDGNTDLLTEQPVLLDVTRASLEELIGGRRLAGGFEAKAAPASAIAERRERIREWRKKTGTPMPVDVTMKNFRKNGAQFINASTTTSALARTLINIRVGTALINPALYISMGPEQWVRGSLDRLANIFTGQSTVGMTSTAQARMTERGQKNYDERMAKLQKAVDEAKTPEERAQAEADLEAGPRSGFLAALGLEQRYTPDQMRKMRDLYQVLGTRSDFKGMVYRDLMFLRPVQKGIGNWERASEKYATFGTKLQDPTYGMPGDTLARRYVENAMAHFHALPTLHVITEDQLIAELSTNPGFLQDRYPDAHRAALNAIAQIRSLKPTVLKHAIDGVVNPLAGSPNSMVNFLGSVALKMPLIFSGYSMNVVTTITGMQGADQMLAMFLHGRETPGSITHRVRQKLAGQDVDDGAMMDLEDVMESIDLTRAFIRGGITHTGLFMTGLLAGGLGLSGEDDESKKRRKLSALQGQPFVYDPRQLQNDFRNKDALFLDWMPLHLGDYFKNGDPNSEGGARDMVQLSWMLKQFVSPIMGMERYFETGDFSHVTWGFQDAVGAFPLINPLMWGDAVDTADEFAAMANDEAQLGGASNHIKAAGFLTTAVGTYERMLFESAFVNAIYVGHDRWDRDPYVLPLRDSDGTIQRDIEGEARAQNLTTEQFIVQNRDKLTREIAGGEWQGQLYIDPKTSEIKVGYLNRDQNSATIHALTENRATLAGVMDIASSLFSGAEADYSRYQMPIKEREAEKPQLTEEQAQAFVRAASEGLQRSGQSPMVPKLTVDEIASVIKQDYIDAGIFYNLTEVMQMATQQAKAQGPEPLSILDAQGNEALTQLGAHAVFRGLQHGTVHLGDASLGGIYIPFEMRQKIQDDWMKELVQEGMTMGLDQTKATSRMKRLWYGPIEDSTVQGLGDILWNKDISYTGKIRYQQLNTTYVMGPDGRPWATGFKRDGFLGALGIKPVKGTWISEQPATGVDSRLNTTNLIAGMNTGLRGLQLVDESRDVPTDVEIGKAIEDAIAKAAGQQYTPYTPYAKSGSGYTPFGHRGYSRHGYGGGSGYSSGGYADFSKMYSLPHARAPYGQNIPYVNLSNPLVRRSDIRRERVWSERGRLKQWQ